MRKFLLLFILLQFNLFSAVIQVLDSKADKVLGKMLDEGNAGLNEKYYSLNYEENDEVYNVTQIKDKNIILQGNVAQLKKYDILLDKDWYAFIKLLRNNGDIKAALSHIDKKERATVFADFRNSDFEEFIVQVETLLLKRITQVEEMVKSSNIKKTDSSLFLLYKTIGDFYFILASDYQVALRYYQKGIDVSSSVNSHLIELLISCGNAELNLNNQDNALKYYLLAENECKKDDIRFKTLLEVLSDKKKYISGEAQKDFLPTEKKPAVTDKQDSLQKDLVNSAQQLIGKKWQSGSLYKGKKFNYDCSGTVRRIYWDNGIDLYFDAANPQYRKKNGVYIIYNTYALKIHTNKKPDPGDLIFFNNTYDKNRDGKWNDKLTHIGIVEKIDNDGTITYIHHSSKGITRYKMNLYHPTLYKDPKTGKVLNSFIRRKNSANDPKTVSYVSGYFFAGFAGVVE